MVTFIVGRGLCVDGEYIHGGGGTGGPGGEPGGEDAVPGIRRSQMLGESYSVASGLYLAEVVVSDAKGATQRTTHKIAIIR